MKMYKVNFTGETVSQVITVPVDSEFLVGISDGNPGTRVVLSHGGTPLEPMEDPIGNYTAFPFDTTGQRPSRKRYNALLETEVELPPTEVSGLYGLDGNEEYYALGTTSLEDLIAHKPFGLYRLTSGDEFIAQGDYEFAAVDPTSKDLIYLPVEIPEDTSTASGMPSHIRFFAYGQEEIEFVDAEMSFADTALSWNPEETATKEIPGGTKWVVTKKANLKVIVDDMSIAYRDLTGGEPTPPTPPYDPARRIVVPTGDIDIDSSNAADLANTVYSIDDSIAMVSINLDGDSFGDGFGNTLFEFNVLWNHSSMHEDVEIPISVTVTKTGIGEHTIDGPNDFFVDTPDGALAFSEYAESYLLDAESLITFRLRYVSRQDYWATAEIHGKRLI